MTIYVRDKLFQLIRCTLWGDSVTDKLSMKEFRQVLSIAADQTVYGLVFDAMKGMDTEGFENKMPVYEAIGMAEKIAQQNERMNAELAEFISLCKKEGLEFIVVKGQTVGSFYLNPLLRQSGDIDFLVHSDYDIAKVIAEKALDVSLPTTMSEFEIGFNRNGIKYELHTKLRGWAKKQHQKIWDERMEREWQNEYYVDVNGVKVRTLSPTLNAAYIFIHLFFHFIREGVSLRQFCDWAMVLHHYRDEIDRKELEEILSILDMLKAYKAFGSILVDKLGLSESDFPFAIEHCDRKWKEKILKDMFAGGNFGKLNHDKGFTFQISRFRSLWYKIETMGVAMRNSLKYYRLCPSEVGGMLPRLVKGNLKILFSQR